jgi:anti-sigma factor RsiW
MTHPGELLSAYLDGELNPGEERKVLDHLRGCERCGAEFEEMHEARSMLRSLPTLELPVGVVPEVDPPANVVPLHRRPRAWLAAAAAAVVIVIGLATVFVSGPTGIQMPIEDLSNQFRARNSLERTFTPIDVVPVVVEGAE